MEQNKQKLTEAYNEYSDAIFRYCYFKISDREKALDFVQETFVRLWKCLQNGDDVKNTKTFLYTIARHIIIDEYRKKKTLSLDELVGLGMEPADEKEEPFYSALDIERVMSYVSKLPENYSSIIVMRYVRVAISYHSKGFSHSQEEGRFRIHRRRNDDVGTYLDICSELTSWRSSLPC
jgi:RNA polymerase sigma-70 factor (ECF subfamily)